jgi:hypothetical protein
MIKNEHGTLVFFVSMQICEILPPYGLDVVTPTYLITLQPAHVYQTGQVPLHSANLQSNFGLNLSDFLRVIVCMQHS